MPKYNGLTSEQIKAIEYLTAFDMVLEEGRKLTYVDCAAHVGVDVSTVSRWMNSKRDTAFREHYEKAHAHAFLTMKHRIDQRLLKACLSKETKPEFLKLFYQLIGGLVDKRETTLKGVQPTNIIINEASHNNND